MSHHQLAVLFFAAAAFFMLLTWLLSLAKRDTLRLDLVAWACAFVAAVFVVA